LRKIGPFVFVEKSAIRFTNFIYFNINLMSQEQESVNL